jgi:hypothetical protein
VTDLKPSQHLPSKQQACLIVQGFVIKSVPEPPFQQAMLAWAALQ